VCRLYFVYLLCGVSVSAIAGETDRGKYSSIFNSSVIQDVSYIPDSVLHYKYSESDVPIRMVGTATASSLSVNTKQPASVAEQKKNLSLDYLAQYEGLGSNIGKLLLHKRVEFSWDKFKVKFQTDYASIEAGQLKVSLQPDSTAIMWRQGI